jgi:Leucine-rich repeat (LRR) protein
MAGSIDLCLARRTSAEKVVFVFSLVGEDARANTDFYSDIHRHYSLSSNLQFESGPSLVIEWHTRARSILEVTCLLGETTGGRLNDGRPISWCRSLHALDLRYSFVDTISVLAWCQDLHTLDLRNTLVSDVSALASCKALHTLNLSNTQVSDVSALASCEALHTLNLEKTRVADVSALVSCQATSAKLQCE